MADKPIARTTKGKGANYQPTSQGAGMTEAGRKAYNAKNNANLKAPAPNPKKTRIAAGSGEKMRPPGAKGAPTAKAFKDSAKTAKPKK